MSNVDTTVPDETIQAVTARLSATTEKPWLIRGDDIEAILAEVRRLTDANTRLTDLVRHARGPLHEDGLLTDAEYAALAEDSGAVVRLTTIAQLQGDVARETRAKNVAIGERDEAQAALATARLDGARVMQADAAGILDAEARRMQDAADALLAEDGDVTDIEKNHRLNSNAIMCRMAAGKIRALDPAAVVGSGS